MDKECKVCGEINEVDENTIFYTCSKCKLSSPTGKLFEPKPSGRLLTDLKVSIEERTKNCVGADYGSIKENLEWLVAKTASIKNAECLGLIFERHKEYLLTLSEAETECQARIEALIEEIRTRIVNMDYSLDTGQLEALNGILDDLKATQGGEEG